jgi:A/G-specific adenine glycosylase
MDLAAHLISWYLLNKRDLPWRMTRDPYLVWVSEIILQQTQVEQGLDYYNRFVAHFRDVMELAQADEKEVLKFWQGLGYYTRARNLLATAREIVEKYGGRFPETYKELISLKGIGEYTASAILSFSFNQAYAVVDGNVMRVLSRFEGITTPVNTMKGKREISEIAAKLIPVDTPGLFNQAIMEFGALQCTPQNPLCYRCVLNTQCRAFLEDRIKELPVKKDKVPPKNRYFNYLVVNATGRESMILLRKRTANDIWKNLYDFPLIESKRDMNVKQVLRDGAASQIIGDISVTPVEISHPYTHLLSHQNIHARFFIIRIDHIIGLNANDLQFIRVGDLGMYPVPKLIETFLDEYRGFLC